MQNRSFIHDKYQFQLISISSLLLPKTTNKPETCQSKESTISGSSVSCISYVRCNTRIQILGICGASKLVADESILLQDTCVCNYQCLYFFLWFACFLTNQINTHHISSYLHFLRLISVTLLKASIQNKGRLRQVAKVRASMNYLGASQVNANI